jgi:hypothetical protein
LLKENVEKFGMDSSSRDFNISFGTNESSDLKIAKLFTYFTAVWSSFGNEKVFSQINFKL